jgi:signal transduction histidine kinase
MRLSFPSKVSLIVALLLVLSVFAYASVSIVSETDKRREDIIDEKKSLNELVAFTLESAEYQVMTWYKKYIVRKVAEPDDVVYCRLVKPNGEIFVSNIEEERGMFIRDPAIATNETVIKQDIFNGETILVIVSPTYEGHTVWLGFSTRKIDEAVIGMIISTLATAMVIVSISTPISYLIVSRFLNPIKKLTSLCVDISKGNFTVQSSAQSKDEIGVLSNTFNDMARKLETMREEIRRSERLSAIGQLATMVGHDLRNPLTSIRNAAYYIKMKLGTSTNEKIKEMLSIVDEEVNYANKIINDLLDFSASRKPEFTKVNLVSIIQEALARLDIPKNVKIVTKFDALPIVEGDPDQLRRVFLNIASNGVQAMPEGGKLTVSARNVNDFVEVAFTDTGVGITEENLSKLFTPLFTTKSKGIGLGLCICKNIVEAHNGKINVISKVGVRSTFTIKLPIHHQINGGEKHK